MQKNNFQKKAFGTYVLALFFMTFTVACNPTSPLDEVDPRMNDISQKLAEDCFGTQGDVVSHLNELKALLDEIYQGQLTPQTDKKGLAEIDQGYELTSYPPDQGLAGGVVARPIAASLQKFIEAMLWDNQLEVWNTDTLTRYIFYDREYLQGDKAAFKEGTGNLVGCKNHVQDVGQRGISFEYYTDMIFARYKDASLPADGAILLCSNMPEKATRITGGYDSYMDKLMSLYVYYPIDENNTYRVLATWLKAGGSFWFVSVGANSGNIGQGIRDDFEGITNFVLTH